MDNDNLSGWNAWAEAISEKVAENSSDIKKHIEECRKCSTELKVLVAELKVRIEEIPKIDKDVAILKNYKAKTIGIAVGVTVALNIILPLLFRFWSGG
jgi:hypothetical protein